jgi:hypothetical protein
MMWAAAAAEKALLGSVNKRLAQLLFERVPTKMTGNTHTHSIPLHR